jgi:hypothetical protein
LFLLFILLLIPCCCCFFFLVIGKRRKDRKYRKEVPQHEEEADKHRATETELSPPLHYFVTVNVETGKGNEVSPATTTHGVTTTHHNASV